MSEKSSHAPPVFELETPEGMAPERLDRYLGSRSDIQLTRSKAQKLIAEGLVLVNGETATVKYKLKGGEKLTITIPAPEVTDIIGENIPLDVVFEDAHLLVIDKPAGLVTHPGAGNFTGTIVNAVVHHLGRLPDGGAPERPGIVHRLDKNTSGLMIIAKTEPVYLALQQAIEKREVKRSYLALVCGHLVETEGLIDLPIGRSTRDRKKMAVTPLGGREARTEYHLRERYRTYDLLDILLHTGRTHQIRVHFAHLGHPVFGDPEYGGREKWHRGVFAPERPLAKKLLEIIDRQALHACRIEFTHPVTSEILIFESEPPEDYRAVLALLNDKGQ